MSGVDPAYGDKVVQGQKKKKHTGESGTEDTLSTFNFFFLAAALNTGTLIIALSSLLIPLGYHPKVLAEERACSMHHSGEDPSR